jgi:hypothetical protein
VPFAKVKFSEKGELVDGATKRALENSLSAIIQAARKDK